MIIEALALGVIAKTFYSAGKSLKADEAALKQYAKAFERSSEAELLVKQKAEYTDKRIANVAKKKRAVIEDTVPKFIEVYSKIQKIELSGSTKLNQITLLDNSDKLAALNAMTISVKRNFTDKELVCGWVFRGIGKMMEKDSELYLSAANNQMSAANVAYSQAESVADVYDAIAARADRIAKLIMTMNALFAKSIKQTEETIERNGLNVKNYSEFDEGVLITCVNLAAAMSEFINIPVVDEHGQICETAEKMLITGENYLNQMKQAIV